MKIDSDIYTRREYIQIRSQIDELLEGIKFPKKDDPKEELDVFREIYTRLAKKISYDNYAITSEGNKDVVLQRDCRNLYNGLVKEKCVCLGYAKILMNVLSCRGIECKGIIGYKENGGGHAWNQVKIGGRWFNVDLTNDRNDIIGKEDFDIRTILKTDAEFLNNSQYSLNQNERERCDTESIDFFREGESVPGEKTLGEAVRNFAKNGLTNAGITEAYRVVCGLQNGPAKEQPQKKGVGNLDEH